MREALAPAVRVRIQSPVGSRDYVGDRDKIFCPPVGEIAENFIRADKERAAQWAVATMLATGIKFSATAPFPWFYAGCGRLLNKYIFLKEVPLCVNSLHC